MFHFMTETLKEQYKACADAARLGPDASGSAPTTTIFQYGDWFGVYPHGVSQSDFEDPAVAVKKEKGEDAVLGEAPGYHTVEQFFEEMKPLRPQDPDTAKQPNKRKTPKKAQAPRPEQLDPVQTNIPPNIPPTQQTQIHSHSSHQIAAPYNPMSPATPVNIYSHNQAHNPYYSQNILLPSHQQGILPQLDRQLVFGAYAGMDPSSMNAQSLLDNSNSWDNTMQMNGGGMGAIGGIMNEVSSAWFMPFNMDPPEIGNGQDVDMFSNLGGGYGMQVNNGPGMGGHGGT